MLDRRLDSRATDDFVDHFLPTIAVHHGTEITHERALAAHRARTGRRRPSLTDCLAFQLMRGLEIGAASSFDRHFLDAGFELGP